MQVVSPKIDQSFLFDIAKHSLVGSVSGAFALNLFVPLAVSQGTRQFHLCDSRANAVGLRCPPSVRGRRRDPPAHLEAGIVEPLTSPVPEERRFITIRSSEKPPDDATVQVRFRDRWFYIDATDAPSKRSFTFLRTFIGIRLADPGAAKGAPVLTVPVN